MNVLAIIQARMGSSRLPGKVLLPVGGTPLIIHMLERLKRAKSLDKIYLATSVNAENDPLQKTVEKFGVTVFRGPENDVLSRYYEIAQKYKPTWVVRMTGDCPLIDPAMVDELVNFARAHENEYDYLTNAVEPTFPDGLDIEVFRFSLLEKAHKLGDDPAEREHVTAFFLGKNPQAKNIRTYHFKGAKDYSHLRWTVDCPEDFELVKTIFEHFLPHHPHFTWQDALQFVQKNPQLMELNKKFIRNENFNY